MSDKNIAKALLGAFPTLESFYDFKEIDWDISRSAIPGIVNYAYSHSIITEPSEMAFKEFLEKNSNINDTRKPPEGLTFADVLDKLSGHFSINALITQLEGTAKELSLPEIQATMITRLKQRFIVNTPKKRVLLRILAFRLAQKHPELNWHYEFLMQLPTAHEIPTETVHETGGVNITFHLQGQGTVVHPQDVTWLKQELTECIEYLRLENQVSKKAVETLGTTTLNFRIPKKTGSLDEPRLYNEAIRNVMAIAHQMATSWLLYDFSSHQKKLIIIIYAGAMPEDMGAIQQILDMPLHAESGIYLTDFAHLCARFASVKVGFEHYCKSSYPSAVYGGDLWAVTYFLSYSYYDYIPCLLEENMLPRSVEHSSYEDFKRLLHFPEQAGQSSFGAIKAMHRFPQSALLLTEIAKVLHTRNMWFEADTVLASLLLSHPSNVVARLMRMLIYSNIAQTQPDELSARLSFERADAEGDLIVENGKEESDIWHEMGVLNFRQAIKYLDYQREKHPGHPLNIHSSDVMERLEKARSAFLKSITVSPTGKAVNSLYMFGYTLCLLELLANDKKKPDIAAVFRNVSTRIFRNIGWLRSDVPDADNKMEKIFQNTLLTINLFIGRYENLVLCRSNLPFMKYMFALLIWDFAPVITLQICRITLEWLKLALKEAETLPANNISVYHVACGQISAEKFIRHVQETMDVIHKHVSDEDLQQEKDTPQMNAKLKELSDIKLMLLELDRTRTEPLILCA